ncbi:UNVERIFIED_CONTAM: hypothetical protein K2H54_050766 [Gekko kuhli]
MMSHDHQESLLHKRKHLLCRGTPQHTALRSANPSLSRLLDSSLTPSRFLGRPPFDLPAFALSGGVGFLGPVKRVPNSLGMPGRGVMDCSDLPVLAFQRCSRRTSTPVSKSPVGQEAK